MSANDFRLGGFSPALESADHFKIEKSYDLFIGGKWVKASKQIATTNPATGETLSKVGLAGKKEVNKAVKAARKAYDDAWSKMPAAERGKYLYQIARLIQERAKVGDERVRQDVAQMNVSRTSKIGRMGRRVILENHRSAFLIMQGNAKAV